MTEKRIHDLPLKAKPDATHELEIQETADGSSRKTTAAGLLAAGLPVTAPTVFLGTSSASVRLEAVSASRVQFVGQGGTPVLAIDGAALWIAGPTPVDWRVQRQTWPTAPQYASAGDVNSGVGFPAANAVGVSAGGVEVARFITTAGAVNYLEVKPSATGQPVDIEPDGTDAEIPLRLRGKGGAKVRIGQVTPAADPAQFTPDAYVELQDEDGNTYFVPCMTSAW